MFGNKTDTKLCNAFIEPWLESLNLFIKKYTPQSVLTTKGVLFFAVPLICNYHWYACILKHPMYTRIYKHLYPVKFVFIWCKWVVYRESPVKKRSTWKKGLKDMKEWKLPVGIPLLTILENWKFTFSHTTSYAFTYFMKNSNICI